jgi:hypothetical protein
LASLSELIAQSPGYKLFKNSIYSLLHDQHQLHIADIGTVDRSPVTQITFALGTFFSQNVAFVSMFSFDFSCSGKSEPFFGTGIGFHFWHFPAF